ncbi:MAG: hypothetical protein NTV58_12215 [Deltaproteobacteria bacterium]|nr:hypothetical protein [Deltaproteobacteria bacterium]
MSETWRDYIKTENLPEDYQLIAGAIGLENTIKLAQTLPSIYIYLLSPDRLFKPAKVKYILERYAQSCPEKPFNHRRIALETGLSIREIYDIIAARKEESKQQSLFDDA